MYKSTLGLLSEDVLVHSLQNADNLCFGIKLFKDDEVLSVAAEDTRNKWNILVFMSGAYTPDMGYKETGVYIAPVLEIQDEVPFGEHFEGYLLSIPFPSWRAFDTYNLERRFKSFHFRPFVELDRKEAQSLCLMMSMLEASLAEDGIRNDDDMEFIYLCRALIAAINRYFGSRECPHEAVTTGNRYVDRFLSLVEKHCLKEKKLEFYAGQLGISTKHLSMLVSKTTGKKANKWISDGVIDKASKLLISTPLQISEIAKRMGFSNSSDFCRYYKASTGITPMQYRKEFQRLSGMISI